MKNNKLMINNNIDFSNHIKKKIKINNNNNNNNIYIVYVFNGNISYRKCLAINRTITDLENKDSISKEHVHESFFFVKNPFESSSD